MRRAILSMTVATEVGLCCASISKDPCHEAAPSHEPANLASRASGGALDRWDLDTMTATPNANVLVSASLLEREANKEMGTSLAAACHTIIPSRDVTSVGLTHNVEAAAQETRVTGSSPQDADLGHADKF